MYLFINALTEIRLAIVILHDVQTLVDGLLIFQWKHQPAAQQTTSHRTHCLIDDIKQRFAVILHGMNQLQTANRELIEPYIFVLFDARDGCDMAYLGMLCLFKVL